MYHRVDRYLSIGQNLCFTFFSNSNEEEKRCEANLIKQLLTNLTIHGLFPCQKRPQTDFQLYKFFKNHGLFHILLRINFFKLNNYINDNIFNFKIVHSQILNSLCKIPPQIIYSIYRFIFKFSEKLQIFQNSAHQKAPAGEFRNQLSCSAHQVRSFFQPIYNQSLFLGKIWFFFNQALFLRQEPDASPLIQCAEVKFRIFFLNRSEINFLRKLAIKSRN